MPKHVKNAIFKLLRELNEEELFDVKDEIKHRIYRIRENEKDNQEHQNSHWKQKRKNTFGFEGHKAK